MLTKCPFPIQYDLEKKKNNTVDKLFPLVIMYMMTALTGPTKLY